MEQVLTAYYADNARKLHGVVEKILSSFGGISDKDMDDFYSLANEVFVEAMKGYDREQPFDVFLYSCLSKKIRSEMSRRNREKRKMDRISVSIDMPVDGEDGTTIGDIIADELTVEKEVFERGEEGYSRRMLLYLSRLSKLQRDVLTLRAAGYLPNEIRKELHINAKQYAECCEAIYSYRNVSVL